MHLKHANFFPTLLRDYLKAYKLVTLLIVGVGLATLGACSSDTSEPEKPIVRGMKAFKVSSSTNSEIRRYPSIVRPAQESRLAFQVSGKLGDILLEVGQAVRAGQTLASIDPVSLELRVKQSEASLEQAKATAKRAKSDFQRISELKEKDYVTQSEFDAAQSQSRSSEAQVESATRQLELAREDLSRANLIAPYDGTISSINVQDFAQVSAGQVILGIFSESGYEVRFSVPAVIVNSLSVGDKATITFADIPGKQWWGHVKELGTRAEQVSAFPVVVTLDEAPPELRAGMAADVELKLKLFGTQSGFLVPLSSFYFDLNSSPTVGTLNHRELNAGTVFVYAEETRSVSRRTVTIVGIRENMAIVSEGLAEGDIVAAAGVSYLHDGQRVNLLPFE